MSSRLVLFALAVALACPAVALAGADAPTLGRPNAGALCDRLAGDADDADFGGDGVPDDDLDAKTAEAACREAVDAHPGERRYLTELARAVRKGSDGSAALPFYRKAADLGSAHALFAMGSIYESGDGLDQDFARAADDYRQAMAAGSVVAIASLAYLYDSGELGPNGAVEALGLYEKQIAAGDNYGLIALGCLYEWGRGTARDERKAEATFRQAIADADPDLSAYGKNALAWMWAVDGRRRRRKISRSRRLPTTGRTRTISTRWRW